MAFGEVGAVLVMLLSWAQHAQQVLDDNKERVLDVQHCSSALPTWSSFWGPHLYRPFPCAAQDGFIPTVELRAILMKEAP